MKYSKRPAVNTTVSTPTGTVHKESNAIWREIKKNKYIYIILLPGLLFYILFCYVPMYGILLAFKDYQASKGILGSPFIGLQNFKYIFRDYEFFQACKNTLIISFRRLIFEFPAPIILALLINELKDGPFKKSVQTIYTFPHFLSWVVISGITINFLGNDGALNNIISLMGFERQEFLANKDTFIGLLHFTSIWKGAGWSSIIYLASIAAINMEQYEAAIIDGANRLQKMIYITWPGMRSTVIILLILQVGNAMNAGFDQIFNMYNPAVLRVSDIIDTYIYRITFQTGGDFGFSTAVGLFKSVINFILLITADRISKLIADQGIF